MKKRAAVVRSPTRRATAELLDFGLHQPLKRGDWRARTDKGADTAAGSPTAAAHMHYRSRPDLDDGSAGGRGLGLPLRSR